MTTLPHLFCGHAILASAVVPPQFQPVNILGAPYAGASSSGGGAGAEPGNAEQLAVNIGFLEDVRLGPIHLKQDKALFESGS